VLCRGDTVMRMAGEEGLVAVGWKVIAEMGIAQI
jgi:hypothetical protein